VSNDNCFGWTWWKKTQIHFVYDLDLDFDSLCCCLDDFLQAPIASPQNADALALLHWQQEQEHHVPGILLPVLERIMKAHTTESENTGNKVFSVYISIASVKENRARSSAQLRSRSASAAYNALP